jgi:hypothetical protein
MHQHHRASEFDAAAAILLDPWYNSANQIPPRKTRRTDHEVEQMTRAHILPLAAGALAVAAITTAPANAGEYGYVTARSEFGNGTVSGRVRHTRLGYQVQLPGGSWIYCSKSCSETLRVKTVDFWYSDEGMGPNQGITNEGSVLGGRGITFGW